MNVGEFVSTLFEIRDNIHISHLQTRSYAEHKALNELYEGIVDLADRFTEAYQGKYGIVTGYKPINIKEGFECCTYLKAKSTIIESYRLTLTDGFLQQICDDILELIYSSCYKLKYLS